MGPLECSTQMASRLVQLFCTAHGRVSSAMPGHYAFACGDLETHLIRGSLGPAEAKSQTTSRSVQLFFYRAHGRESLYFTMGHLFPRPYNCHFPLFHWATQCPNPLIKRHLYYFSHVAQLTAEFPYTLQWAIPSPLKIAPSHEASRPHLIYVFLGPPEFSTQTASRSVQLFLQCSLLTDRQTTLLDR